MSPLRPQPPFLCMFSHHCTSIFSSIFYSIKIFFIYYYYKCMLVYIFFFKKSIQPFEYKSISFVEGSAGWGCCSRCKYDVNKFKYGFKKYKEWNFVLRRVFNLPRLHLDDQHLKLEYQGYLLNSD